MKNNVPYFFFLSAGTGVITKSELKYFYTAFMDVGKLGEECLDEITNNAFGALTSVSLINSMKQTKKLCINLNRGLNCKDCKNSNGRYPTIYVVGKGGGGQQNV